MKQSIEAPRAGTAGPFFLGRREALAQGMCRARAFFAQARNALRMLEFTRIGTAREPLLRNVRVGFADARVGDGHTRGENRRNVPRLSAGEASRRGFRCQESATTAQDDGTRATRTD